MAPPLRPDAPTARRWLSEELAHARYRDTRSLADLLQDWLDSLFRSGDPATPPVGTMVAILLVGLLAVAAFFVIRRFRGGAASGADWSVAESAVGPVDDPAAHRRAAADHRAAGRYDAAVIESFRAIVGTGADRALVRLLPGLTAQRAADELAAARPRFAADLRQAADRFDRARYAAPRPGGQLSTAEDADAVADLDRQLTAAGRSTTADHPAAPNAAADS